MAGPGDHDRGLAPAAGLSGAGAVIQQSPAGLAASPSHPTRPRPCPLPGLWLRDPPSWHLGLSSLTLPKPAPSQPRQALWPWHLLGSFCTNCPWGGSSRRPPPAPTDSRGPTCPLCLRDHPELRPTPAPLLACPLGPAYLLCCLSTPHPPGPLDPKARFTPSPHPSPAPMMSLSTPTHRSQGVSQTILSLCLLKRNDSSESLTLPGYRRAGWQAGWSQSYCSREGLRSPPACELGQATSRSRSPTGTVCFDSCEGRAGP